METLLTAATLSNAIALVKEKKPLVHNITNFVVMQTTANMLLTLGASPIMAHAPEELEEILSDFKTIRIVEGFVSLIGSNAEGRENPEDIDIIVKQNKRSLELEAKILSQIPISDIKKFAR